MDFMPRILSESFGTYKGFATNGSVCEQNTANAGCKIFSLIDTGRNFDQTTQDREDSAQHESLSDLYQSSAEQALESTESAEQTPSPDALSTIAGRAGGRSRELFIAEQNQRARDAGKNAGLEHYDNDVYRLINTKNVPTYNDHTFSRPGRYNRLEQSALYNSESFRGVAAESQNYSGLTGKSVVRSRFSGDIVDATKLEGISKGALTEPNGDNGGHRTWLSR
jgi:hypothetical protein